jgi:hypothetical protein
MKYNSKYKKKVEMIELSLNKSGLPLEDGVFAKERSWAKIKEGINQKVSLKNTLKQFFIHTTPQLGYYTASFVSACALFAVFLWGMFSIINSPKHVQIYKVSGHVFYEINGEKTEISKKRKTISLVKGARIITGHNGTVLLGIGNSNVRLGKKTILKVNDFRQNKKKLINYSFDIIEGIAGFRLSGIEKKGVFQIHAGKSQYIFQQNFFSSNFLVDKSKDETVVAVIDGNSEMKEGLGTVKLKKDSEKEFVSLAQLPSNQLFGRYVDFYSPIFNDLKFEKKGGGRFF